MSFILLPLITTDAICTFINQSDSSKQFLFNLDDAITSTSTTLNFSQTANRIITFPDITGTLLTDNSNIGADELKTTSTSVVISGSAPPTVGQVLKATSSTVASWSAQTLYFQGYLNVQTAFTTSPTDIPINIEVVKDSPYTHTANSAEITITVSGDYIITVSASMVATNGTNRSSAELWLNVDTGSGFVEVAGTRRVAYIEQNNYGSSVSFERFISVSNGDIFKVQVNRTLGTSLTAIRSDQYLMTIKSV